MYIHSLSIRIILSELTPNISSNTRSSITFDSYLIFAIDGLTILTSIPRRDSFD